MGCVADIATAYRIMLVNKHCKNNPYAPCKEYGATRPGGYACSHDCAHMDNRRTRQNEAYDVNHSHRNVLEGSRQGCNENLTKAL